MDEVQIHLTLWWYGAGEKTWKRECLISVNNSFYFFFYQNLLNLKSKYVICQRSYLLIPQNWHIAHSSYVALAYAHSIIFKKCLLSGYFTIISSIYLQNHTMSVLGSDKTFLTSIVGIILSRINMYFKSWSVSKLSRE